MWLHKHTNINNLPKGLSNELRASRDVKKAIEELLKEQILLSKPTHYGLEVSLNPKKIKEIKELIKMDSIITKLETEKFLGKKIEA